ncbi:Metacaspase-1 -like protein [Gossypium arboreum]|uniref:Metacaspase-1-like protein n=1 Tax=Gossypium arboreum TaxID=29729 RepID=A0A0B0P3Q8_GOSAR|nr:Metacaspase-1 -like protein [Gossypium arboreum]
MKEPSKIPTKQNIRKALKWLVYGCQPGDSLVFHFSGHGTRQKDYNHDEVDGFDEALCPLDHETEGNIIDDEINDTIVKPLTRGTTLHAIIDACYSGTVLDLPFAFTGTNVRTGAMTYSFVQAIQNERRLTYGHLLNAMRYTIGDVSKAHGASQV